MPDPVAMMTVEARRGRDACRWGPFTLLELAETRRRKEVASGRWESVTIIDDATGLAVEGESS